MVSNELWLSVRPGSKGHLTHQVHLHRCLRFKIGGAQMNLPELATCMQYKLNIVHIILNDNAFGMIKWKQGLAGFENWGLDLVNPDFVMLAKAYGVHGHRVTKADEFASILQSCLDTEGTHLIEVPFSYESMSAELKRVPAKAEAAVKQVTEEYGSCACFSENSQLDI